MQRLDLKKDATGLDIRQQYERRERGFIAPYGSLSAESRGRTREEAPCPIRTAFQVDRDRILYSNAFRRLKYKTQVFLNPLGDEYRTRLTHTLEVAQISRCIARAMFLNEDLAEAIALGHDLGHTPFGHGGEAVLKELFWPSFSHQAQSLRVVQVLENDGRGLNLTYEVRDGILKHSKGNGDIIPKNPKQQAHTVEGQVVRVADIMAYLNHDLDDAIRSGVIREEQVPPACLATLGHDHHQRASNMMNDLIFNSREVDGKLVLNMSADVYGCMQSLRQFLYENVYRAPQVHDEFIKAKKIMTELYHYFLDNHALLQRELSHMGLHGWHRGKRSRERVVCDFIASMTDRHALDLYARIFFPTPTI
jgi:dGTPase